MRIKIDFPKEMKELFDTVEVDIQGVKVDDPTEFIRVNFKNSETGSVSESAFLPVTDIENYANKEQSGEQEPAEIVREDIKKLSTGEDKNNAGQSPLRKVSN